MIEKKENSGSHIVTPIFFLIWVEKLWSRLMEGVEAKNQQS